MKTQTFRRSLAGILLPFLFASAPLPALELPQGFSLSEKGVLRLGSATLGLNAASPEWRFRHQSGLKEIQTETGDDFYTMSGAFTLPGVNGRMETHLQQTGEGTYSYKGAFHFTNPAKMNTLCAQLGIPLPVESFQLDGKEVKIPAKLGKSALVWNRKIQSLSVKGDGGVVFTLTGNMTVMVQDNRAWDNHSVTVRIFVEEPPLEGNAWKDASVAFNLTLDSPSATPVALGAAANRSLSDPDGSGWLGEGDAADLKTLQAGTLVLAEFPFEIAEDRKALVTGRGFSQGAIQIDLPAGTRAGAVSLLHAADWPQMDGWLPETGKPIGYIDVVYADGQTQAIPVRTEMDCSHWKTISLPLPNAVPAFIGDADGVPAGLYASNFALAQENPVSLSFRPASPENTAWMIAAVTLSNRPVTFPPVTVKRGSFTLEENARWKRLDFSLKTVPGSPLDFSAFYERHAPAGKYGAVRVNEAGEFTFENAPDKRLRLYGVNFCHSANFQEKEDVDELVDRLVRVGYNAIRIHHMDRGMIAADAPDSLTFDPVKLDKLDYLFAKCKEKGLYIATDLFVSRRLKPGDNIDVEDPETLKSVKGLLPVNRAALENWKEFARRWMLHRNPYTGLTWAEDPALAILGMVNENFLHSACGRTPELVRLYRERYEVWLSEKKASAGTDAEIDTSFEAFLADLVDALYEEMFTFVRDELKVKAMLTGDCSANPFTGDDWDFVDGHLYFAHPSFPEKAWTAPIRFTTGSSLNLGFSVPGNLMARRIYGKPLTITEINYCIPNPNRAESGPLMGVFAARQNWGGLWRFAWSHGHCIKPSRLDVFDAKQDPLAQLSDRIITALYLRGDLPVAAPRLTTTPTTLTLPREIRELGLRAQIGFALKGKPLPEDVQFYKSGMEVPDDGCVRYDAAAGTLAVKTDRSEVVTLPRGDAQAGLLSVRNADGFMTVALISKDEKPLAESRDVLVLHLTNVLNSGDRFDREDLLRAWGDLPCLVERRTASLELKTDTPWRVVALKTDGAEFGEVKTDYQDGLLRFALDSACYEGGVMAYHLTR